MRIKRKFLQQILKIKTLKKCSEKFNFVATNISEANSLRTIEECRDKTTTKLKKNKVVILSRHFNNCCDNLSSGLVLKFTISA